MTRCYAFDADRPHALFVADAYEGGRAWEEPSSPTLGTATLYGHRIVTATEGESAGASVVVEETRGDVRSYLVPWPGETARDFDRRRRLAVYVNLVEPIVDAYVDAIVPRVTRSLGDADPMLANLDGDGQAWPEFVSDVALQAALDGVCAAVIDLPAENTARSRAEEIELGVGLRAALVPLASWAWLSLDREGRVEEFAYVDGSTLDDRSRTQTVRLWVWRAGERGESPAGSVGPAEVTGSGSSGSPGGWALYEVTLLLGAELSTARPSLAGRKPLRSGPLHSALNGRPPVVFAYHRRIRARTASPRGKSLAAGPAAIGRQIYQLLSQVEDTQRRAPPFLSVPTAARGGLEPETQVKVGPGSALPAPEGAGSPQWVTFPAEPLADLRAHAAFLMSLAFRVSGLEIQADASAQVQSGEALRVRSRDFEARAGKFARSLADFERRALDIVAALLGVKRETLSVSYPQRHVLGDPSELLAAAVLLLQQVGDRMGAEGTVEAMRQAISAALALDDATLTRVMAEIRARVEEPTPEQSPGTSAPMASEGAQ